MIKDITPEQQEKINLLILTMNIQHTANGLSEDEIDWWWKTYGKIGDGDIQ